MQLISNNKTLVKTLVRLINSYTDISFAVAWATANHKIFSLLKENSSKISRAVIGIHFYQTHPEVLKSFKESENVRFIFQTEGVFHPKIYLFKSKHKWEAIIGSANLTAGALGRNAEAVILIGGMLDAASGMPIELDKLIESYWNEARSANSHDVVAYQAVWTERQPVIKRLSGKYGAGKASKTVIESSVMTMAWPQYYQAVTRDKHHGFEGRCELLKVVSAAFLDYDSFMEMTLPLRKTIAGLPNDKESHWGWFGSMRGAGHYHQAVNENNAHLSAALDEIPLRGIITKREYDSYIKKFILAFPNGRHGVGIASRLLAMKRPDQFVCLSSKNKRGLCKDFGITQSKIDYDFYWEEFIERIRDAPWWNSDEPKEKSEKGVWLGRAAMLDAIFYEGKEIKPDEP